MTTPALTSNQFDFAPSNADIFIEAFDRIGMRPTALTREHFFSARRSVHYQLVDWANRGINLWAVDKQTINLLPPQNGVGVIEYFPPVNTVQMLTTVYTIVNGGGPGLSIDRMMVPMSLEEFREIPNKLQPGTPTRYWFERTIPPKVTIWQADVAQGNIITYDRMRRLQDANPQMGETPDVEYRFLDAFVAELTERLAEKYAPARLREKKAETKEAWDSAANANRDDVPITMRPNLAGFWRP